MTTILEIDNVSKNFGAFTAVDQCSLNLEAGAISGLIGPNGAGKSTLFNIVAGVFAPDSGEIRLDGQSVTGLSAHKMYARGLLRTFQIPHEFSSLTAMENLMLVPHHQEGENLANALFRPQKIMSREVEVERKASDIIEFMGLSHIKNELAGNLSGGQKKLLELGRTMMVDAKVILLDEIGAGVNRSLLKTLSTNIQKLNRELKQTFFIIEHNMQFISTLCHNVTVLVEGKVATSGPPERVLIEPKVVQAYFGGGKRVH